MGWTTVYGASRRDIIDELTRDETNEKRVYRTLRKCFRGNVMYALMESGPHGETTKWIAVHLLGRDGNRGWGYKSMDETVGPIYYECPVSYLDAADPATAEYAIEWRKTVREGAAKKPKKGETWTLVGCNIPEVKITSLKPLRGRYAGVTYKIKRKLLGEKRNETAAAPVVQDMSKATMTIYLPDGTVTKTEHDPAKTPDLSTLQEAVGGYIEPVSANLPEGCVAYADEEGRLKGLPHNPKGTAAVKWPYPIVGPVVVLEGFRS